MGLFGKSRGSDPKEQIQLWTSRLRKEDLQLNRQKRGIDRELLKTKASLKNAAKKGDKEVCVILAKEIVRANKAVSRIYTAKSHISSVQLQMHQQLGMLRVMQAMQSSSEVMRVMQQLVRVPEVAATMRQLSSEMARAGLIEEMVDDAMDTLEDPDELEEEAEQAVDKVLWEVTKGELGRAPETPTTSLTAPVAEPAGLSQQPEESDSEELEQMQQRLEALRS